MVAFGQNANGPTGSIQDPTKKGAKTTKGAENNKSAKNEKGAKKAPPPVPRPRLDALTAQLDQKLKTIPPTVPQDLERDLKGYRRAIRMGFDLKEDQLPGGSNRMEKVLLAAIARADDLAQGKIKESSGWNGRFYQSRVDGSLQPYVVSFPKDGDETKPRPVELILHGRSDGLTESLFLSQHESAKPPASPHILVEVFGRGNNAYRWAGETDCFEVLEDLKRRDGARIDPDRIVLRGFSMGGAGTWHIGMHHAERFCAIQPGAGFTKTIGYAKTVPADLPDWKKRLLTRYDAIASATNVAMVPVVAYSGGDDPQKEAALAMERALEGEPALRSRIKHIIAPGLAHKMPPEWKTKVDQQLEPWVRKGLDRQPQTIDWTATSVRYGACHWIRITGLEIQGKPGRVRAQRLKDRYELRTSGITHLQIATQPGDPAVIAIDGANLFLAGTGLSTEATRWHTLEKGPAGWQQTKAPPLKRKSPGLQGPIDDAFMDRFIVTLGRGKPWNAAAQQKAEAELARFRKEWVEYMRGDFPFVEENDITPTMLASSHLVVFGDPGSSTLLAKALDRLAYKWDATSLHWAGKTLESASHLPFSIQPNPLAPTQYLVINSGHTFHEPQFKGTNALLFAQHGDYGIHHIPSGLVVQDGVFTEDWSWPTSPAP